MDVITRLSQKPFVHIIAQARSGSTALYDALQWPIYSQHKVNGGNYKQSFNLSETFKGPMDKIHLERVCKMVESHEHFKLRTMKNLLQDILRYDKKSQKRLFNLPVYTVGLVRRNTFDQVCSDVLMSMDGGEPVGTLDQKYVINKKRFMMNLLAILREKKAMFNYRKHYDEILHYEDIVFPAHINKSLSPPKQLRILNYQEIKAWYHEYMQKSKNIKTVQSAGVNWNIDKTNKA